MRRFRHILLLLFLLPLILPPLTPRAEQLTVFAAASLTDALQDIAALWEQRGQPKLRLSFAASSTLARQIESGAPASLFASADTQWMDYLVQRNLIATETRHDMLGNRLVLVVPADRPRQIAIAPGFDLPALLGPTGRLAIGDPAHVPAGLYAMEALKQLGEWGAVLPRLARTENVRAALLLVERGEAPAGIVYATDAARAPGVAVAGIFPPSSHAPITYPFAIPKAGDTVRARALLAFLASKPARDAFAARGFLVRD